MIGTKGYSVNVNLDKAKEGAIRDLLHYLTSEKVTARFATELAILPSVRAAYDLPGIKNDALLQASLEQWKVGRQMPVVPEMRAIWDAMRPNMQSVMNGSKSPQDAARDMQKDALDKIASMNQ
jgi:maltose-binding protein MalE